VHEEWYAMHEQGCLGHVSVDALDISKIDINLVGVDDALIQFNQPLPG
jgi:hypothetical protein